MTCFITIAGRRWPVEETFKTGKDVFGWDRCQARSWTGTFRHTALSALAQLRAAAIRSALDGSIDLPAAGLGDDHDADTTAGDDISDADLQIPLGDAPVPAAAASPAQPHRTHQAVHRRDRPARHPRQAARLRADHPRPPRLRAALVPPATAAPGHRPLASLQHPADHHQEGVTSADRKEVTECNTIRQPGHHAERQPGHAPGNRDCSTRRALRLLHARESLRSRRYRPGGPYPPPPGVSITNRSPAATATESHPRIGVTEPSACSTQCRPSAPGWPPAIP